MYDIQTYLKLISAFYTYDIIILVAMAGLFLILGLIFMLLKIFKTLIK